MNNNRGNDWANDTANDTKHDDGSPKFGRLLMVLVAVVVFCGVLTWIMGTYFPDFPS